MNILELKTPKEIKTAFSVIKELRPDLSEIDFLRYISIMQKEGCRLFGLFNDEKLVSVTILTIQTNLYYKKHIWIYDLVTAEQERSKGYGEHLLRFIEDLAQKEACETIALSSGLERIDAHRFYTEKMGYTKPSYVFKKGF